MNTVGKGTFTTVIIGALMVILGTVVIFTAVTPRPARTIVVTNYPALAPGQSLNVVDSNNVPLLTIRRFPLSNAEPFSLANAEIFSTNTPVVIRSNGWIIRFK